MTDQREQTERPVNQDSEQLFFKIGDVSSLVGVETHVLRFWEKEFPQIKPHKIGARKRLYRPRDLELFQEIKRLLYHERFTIAGARKRLEIKDFKQRELFAEGREDLAGELPAWKAEEYVAALDLLDLVRRELTNIKKALSGPPAGSGGGNENGDD